MDDVKSSWPLRVGLHTCYNGSDNEMQSGDAKLNSKIYLSSDCTLQLECMKVESLVIVDQHATVNTFPGLVHTARHTMGVRGSVVAKSRIVEKDTVYTRGEQFIEVPISKVRIWRFQ